MTRVDFYLLGDAAATKPLTACRLADKAFHHGHQCYILAPDAEEARNLDRLLWTFGAGSFVPHGLYDAAAAGTETPAYPVVVGWVEPPPACHDVLISLAPQVPAWFGRFMRVLELVGPDDDDKARGRERFRFYRDRGYPLQKHDL
jgi:DNA polymerase-3 subunit chi